MTDARTLQLNNAALELNLLKDIADFLERMDVLGEAGRTLLYHRALGLFESVENRVKWTVSARVNYLFPVWNVSKAKLSDLGKRMSELFRNYRRRTPLKDRNVNYYTLQDFHEFGDDIIRGVYNEIC